MERTRIIYATADDLLKSLPDADRRGPWAAWTGGVEQRDGDTQGGVAVAFSLTRQSE